MTEEQRDDLGEMNPYAAPVVDDGALWNPAGAVSGAGGDGLRSYPLASRWHRFAARFVDQTLWGLAMIPGMGILVAVLYFDRQRGPDSVLFERIVYNDSLLFVAVLLSSFAMLVPFLLFQFYLLVTRGATIGKRLFGLRVVRTFGAPLSWGRVVFLREVLPLVANLIPLGGIFGLVDVLFIFGNSRTCLHDLMADTRVISVGRNPDDWTPEAIAASRWHDPDFA